MFNFITLIQQTHMLVGNLITAVGELKRQGKEIEVNETSIAKFQVLQSTLRDTLFDTYVPKEEVAKMNSILLTAWNKLYVVPSEDTNS